jgi:hypothetical protein
MTQGQHRARLVAALVALALSAQPFAAEAQDPQRLTAAKALFDHAIAAMDQGDYATACRELEEVGRLEPKAIGARLTLAECYERAGRLATAWTAYALAEEAAMQASQPDRQKRAHDRGEALKAKLGRLALEVPGEVRALPGLEIRLDGEVMPPAMWSVPMPLDRGQHTVSVSAAGKRAISKSVEIADGATLVAKAPMYPRIALDMPDEVRALPGLEIRLDGVVLPPARWSVPIPVEPGRHVIAVSADRRDPREEAIVAAQEGATIPAKVPVPPAFDVVRGIQVRAGGASADRGVRLHIVSDTPSVVLAAGSAGFAICAAPCDRVLEPRADQTFVFTGPGIPSSSSFRLDPLRGDVTARVSGGSLAQYWTGSALLIAGGMTVLAAIPAGAAAEKNGPAIGAGTAGAGVAVAAAGLFLLLRGRTTYSLGGPGAVALGF